MKVLIVGLPLFAKRVFEDLSEFDSQNSYQLLDTYESSFDKLKVPFVLPKVDLVYSINGTITTSKIFDAALRLNKKLVMHWVGTDVVKSIASFREGKFNQAFIDQGHHLCEVIWIKEELKELGIEAELLNFANFESQTILGANNKEPFFILSYVANHRPDYYGMDNIIDLAKQLPRIKIRIAGLESYDGDLPDNIELLGWVDNMSEWIGKSSMCLRCTEHDGLSTFVLEALSQGKYVAYNNDFDHCEFTPDVESMVVFTKELMERSEAEDGLVNEEGMAFIESKFNKEYILSTLKNKLESIGNG